MTISLTAPGAGDVVRDPAPDPLATDVAVMSRKGLYMLRFGFLLPALWLASPALAQDAGSTAGRAPAPDAAADPLADTVIVTATRAPTPIDRVASSVTVLDKAAIDRSQDIAVADLLERTPGVSVSRNGGYGTVASLRIRGAEAEQTVVVIDGVKLNDPSSPAGGYNFGNLLIGDASRIEVLRGPQSILWGSQAIGGVVNIVTALPAKPLEGSVDVEAGSRDTVNARAGLGGVAGPVTWRLSATAFTTDGISAIAPAFGGVEKDGYTNQTLTGRVEIALAPGVSADLRGYFGNGRGDFDAYNGDSPEYSTNRELVGYAGFNVALLDGRLRNRIAYGYTDTSRVNYDPRLQPQSLEFASVGRNHRIEYQGGLAIAKGWDATFGVEHERSNFTAVSLYSAPNGGSAGLTGIYAQLSATVLPRLTLAGGVRHDEHSDYGGKTLFQAGGVWALPTGTTLRASYGEGFKAPTLYELFSDYGNRGLAPEQAHGWEAGVEQRLLGGGLVLRGTYFDRRSRDLINFVSCSFTSVLPLCFVPGSTTAHRYGYYQNVARAIAHGVEIAAALHPVAALTIDGNYTWTVAEDRSPGSATFGKWLARRPRHEANGSISYAWPFGLTTGAAIRRSGLSYDDAANTTPLHGYTLVDLRTEMRLAKGLTLFARAENLFDEQYATAYGYGTLGRSVYAGFRGRF